MAKPNAQAARRWILPLVLTTVLLTLGTIWIGWATNNYGWHAPLMVFSMGVTIVSWFGTFSLVAVHCIKKFMLEALKYHRAKLVSDTVVALRRHEAEQWARAAGMTQFAPASET